MRNLFMVSVKESWSGIKEFWVEKIIYEPVCGPSFVTGKIISSFLYLSVSLPFFFSQKTSPSCLLAYCSPIHYQSICHYFSPSCLHWPLNGNPLYMYPAVTLCQYTFPNRFTCPYYWCLFSSLLELAVSKMNRCQVFTVSSRRTFCFPEV